MRSTPSRLQILQLFMGKKYALSHHDIELEIKNDLDRVTVYRTLKTFLEKGIIHKVLDDAGTIKYALCKENCHGKEHHHDHVHFKCTTCGQTSCLDINIPLVKLPRGFVAKENSLLIQGKCPRCSPNGG